jgi:hypothetical protein
LKAKRRSWREDKEIKENKKAKRREPSQEDERDKPHDLEFIHPTSQTKHKFSLDLFLLSVW